MARLLALGLSTMLSCAMAWASDRPQGATDPANLAGRITKKFSSATALPLKQGLTAVGKPSLSAIEILYKRPDLAGWATFEEGYFEKGDGPKPILVSVKNLGDSIQISGPERTSWAVMPEPIEIKISFDASLSIPIYTDGLAAGVECDTDIDKAEVYCYIYGLRKGRTKTFKIYAVPGKDLDELLCGPLPNAILLPYAAIHVKPYIHSEYKEANLKNNDSALAAWFDCIPVFPVPDWNKKPAPDPITPH